MKRIIPSGSWVVNAEDMKQEGRQAKKPGYRGNEKRTEGLPETVSVIFI
jgi:hypothetical protein